MYTIYIYILLHGGTNDKIVQFALYKDINELSNGHFLQPSSTVYNSITVQAVLSSH